MIKVSNLTVKTSKNKYILKDINFSVATNEIKGLIGPSGSGKTTLLKMIMSLPDNNLKIESGEINIAGKNVIKTDLKRKNVLSSYIGFIPQNPMQSFFYHKTVGEQMINTLVLKKIMSKKDAENKLENIIKELNLKNTKKIMNSYPNELSGGMLQRLILANILANEPKIILADEPTSALDKINKNIILEYLIKLKVNSSIILVSHDIRAIKDVASDVLIMLNGMIVFDGNIQNINDIDSKNNKWIDSLMLEVNKEEKEDFSWQNLY